MFYIKMLILWHFLYMNETCWSRRGHHYSLNFFSDYNSFTTDQINLSRVGWLVNSTWMYNFLCPDRESFNCTQSISISWSFDFIFNVKVALLKSFSSAERVAGKTRKVHNDNKPMLHVLYVWHVQIFWKFH